MPSFLAMVGLLLMAAPTPALSAVQDSEIQQTISRKVRAYFSALSSGDMAVVEQTLAEDYLVIGGDGKLEDRAERLTWLRANAKELVALTPTEIRVRPYGATAVVTGLVTIPQGTTAPIEERFTQVWVRRGTAWQMVTSHITIIKK